MAVITKKVGNRFYAYLSVREGSRVVQRYLGPAGAPETEKKIAAFRTEKAVPAGFRRLFWDARLEDIQLKKNADYIIERVLEFGGLAELNWIQRIYPAQRLLQTLASSRALSARSRNFWGLWFNHESA